MWCGRYSPAPLSRMWSRTANVGMGTESYSKDAADNPGKNSQGMAAAPPAKPLAFAAQCCDTVCPSKIHNLSHNQTARPDFTRPNGLLSSSQVETISSPRKTHESSEHPNGSRLQSLVVTKWSDQESGSAVYGVRATDWILPTTSYFCPYYPGT